MPCTPPCPHIAVPHRSSSWPLRCSSCPHEHLRRPSPRTSPAIRHLLEKTNMVPPREASPPVASVLPPARFGDHERAPPPTSLPCRCPATSPPFPVLLSLMASLSSVRLQEPSWTLPQASAAVAGRLHAVLVKNRTPTSSSSQIRPSPSSPPPATSMPTPLT